MKTLDELTVPATPARRLLERDIQEKCVEWARRRGYWARKFSSISQRSVPDYLFARAEDLGFRGPVKFAVEFKAPGKTSTAAQKDEQQVMRSAGWDVFECDSFDGFAERVRKLENAAAV
jgi:hypothetical protein